MAISHYLACSNYPLAKMVETQGLRYSYSSDKEFSFPDLHCEKGESLLIHGKSGIGKTTLGKLMIGLLEPLEGTVSIDHKNLNSLSAAKKDAFRAQHIGFIPQQAHFIPSLNVQEHFDLLQQWTGKVDQDRIHAILQKLNLISALATSPFALSGGQQQRLSTALALFHHPSVVLADEPTSQLDDGHAQSVAELLMTTCQELDSALVIISHDSRLKPLCNRKIELI